jgi:hypothetical protein
MTLARQSIVSVALATVLAPATVALAGSEEFCEIKEVRKATAHLRTVEAAMAAGYAQFKVCVDEPGEGAMGIHYVNGALAGDAVVDPLRPEALMFEPGAHGKMKLVGVEYIVFQDAWDANNDSPPTLFGEEFHLVPAPNRYDIPAFYELHAWVWKHNPSGLFEDWNPNVHCPGGKHR